MIAFVKKASRRRCLLGPAAVLVGIALTSCGSGSRGAQPVGTPQASTVSPSPSESASSGPSSAASHIPSGGTATPRLTATPSPKPTARPVPKATATPSAKSRTGCSLSQLSISQGAPDGGAGHAGIIIRFKNTGTACTLRAYPGLDGVGKNGRSVVNASRTLRGYLGGPGRISEVVLMNGDVASSLVEGLSGRSDGGPPCPDYSSYLVTPPNETHSRRIPSSSVLCYPEIHPVTKGKTGGASTPGA